jgi:protein-S-isoprenylcysteine O-methyltransferase Ste14
MNQAESAERGANVRFPPPAVYVAFILLGWGLSYAAALPVPAPQYVPRTVSLAAGVAILLAGFWLNADAWKLFQRTGQHPAPWKPSPELVLSGAYRFTRNPMYLGMTCIQAGLGLAVNNLWITLLAPFSLLAVHFLAIVPEEKYLTEKFGESYRSYTTKVRRYL